MQGGMQPQMVVQQPGMMVQQQPGMMMQQQPGMMVQQPGMMVQQQPGMMMQQQPGMMVQQPGMVMMQQPMMQQRVVVQQGGGLEKMKSMPGVYVSQKADLTEMLTGIQMPNKFNFFDLDATGMNAMPLRIFRGNEQSNMMLNQIMQAEDRPFKMFLTMTNGDMDLFNFMYLERPSAFCQCDNGEMRVYCLEGGQRLIGVIKGPFTWCDYQLNVHDASGNIRYILDGTFCQKGVLCSASCPCQQCQLSFFNIKDGTGLTTVGDFQRSTTWCSRLFQPNDNYILHFPQQATVEDKMLLMASMILWDFCFFEKPNDNNNGVGGVTVY